MNFSKFIRGFFGIPDYENQPRRGPESRPDAFDSSARNLKDYDDDDDDDDNEEQRKWSPNGPFRFPVSSDPIDFPSFIEHQLEMMSEFMHMFERRDFDGSFFSHVKPDDNDKSLRDNYLKPGYVPEGGRRIPGHPKNFRMDDDIDGVSKADLNKIFDEGGPGLEKEKPVVQKSFFGASSFSSTIRRGDGVVEHHRTVKDAQGNEEVTVTQQIGDKSYSVTTRTDPSGRKEQIENFVNLEREELDDFKKKLNGANRPSNVPIGDLVPKQDRLLFDQFFSTFLK